MKAQQLGNPLGAHLAAVAAVSRDTHFHFDLNISSSRFAWPLAPMLQLTCIKYDVSNPPAHPKALKTLIKSGFTICLSSPCIAILLYAINYFFRGTPLPVVNEFQMVNPYLTNFHSCFDIIW